MQLSLLDCVLVAVMGGGVGFLSGLFGVGGGFLVVPLLNIVVQIPMEFAVGAGACQVLGPATTSLLARDVERKDFCLPLTVCGGLFVGVACGTQLLKLAKEGSLTAQSAWLSVDVLVLGTYFVLLVGLGVFSLWEVWRTHHGRPLSTGWLIRLPFPPYTILPAIRQEKVSIPMVAWFGLGVGFFSGLLGMSGGLILLPGLIYLLGMQTHQGMMASLIIVWMVGVQSTTLHAWNGFIDLRLVMSLLFGGTFGAQLGAELSQKLGGSQLRRGFGWLLLATATLIGGRLIRELWKL